MQKTLKSLSLLFFFLSLTDNVARDCGWIRSSHLLAIVFCFLSSLQRDQKKWYSKIFLNKLGVRFSVWSSHSRIRVSLYAWNLASYNCFHANEVSVWSWVETFHRAGTLCYHWTVVYLGWCAAARDLLQFPHKEVKFFCPKILSGAGLPFWSLSHGFHRDYI